MKLHVEAAGVADGLTLGVPAPEGGGGGVAVGTGQAEPPRRGHSLLGFDEGPAQAVHFGVEPAGVAQVIPGAVPPPQRGLDGAAVDALAALGEVFQQLCARSPHGDGRGAALQAVQHGVLEGRRGPGGAELRPHVGGVGRRVGAVERPRQRSVLLPRRQAAAVLLPRGAVGHGRAGRVGEAARGVRAARGAVRGALGRRLRPDVAGRSVAGLGRAAALQVGQRGQHGAHAGGGHVDGRAGRGVHEAARRSVVGRGALRGRDGQGLVHRRRPLRVRRQRERQRDVLLPAGGRAGRRDGPEVRRGGPGAAAGLRSRGPGGGGGGGGRRRRPGGEGVRGRSAPLRRAAAAFSHGHAAPLCALSMFVNGRDNAWKITYSKQRSAVSQRPALTPIRLCHVKRFFFLPPCSLPHLGEGRAGCEGSLWGPSRSPRAVFM